MDIRDEAAPRGRARQSPPQPHPTARRDQGPAHPASHPPAQWSRSRTGRCAEALYHLAAPQQSVGKSSLRRALPRWPWGQPAGGGRASRRRLPRRRRYPAGAPRSRRAWRNPPQGLHRRRSARESPPSAHANVSGARDLCPAAEIRCQHAGEWLRPALSRLEPDGS